MADKSLDPSKFRLLIGTNIALSIFLGLIMVLLLQRTETEYIKEAQRNAISAQKEKKDSLGNTPSTPTTPSANVPQSNPDKPTNEPTDQDKQANTQAGQDKPAADTLTAETLAESKKKQSAFTSTAKDSLALAMKRDSIAADSLKRIECMKLLYTENSGGVTFLDIVLLMLIAGALGGVLCNLRGFFMHFRDEQKQFPANLEVPYYVRIFMGAGAGLFVYFVINFLISSTTAQYLATNVPFQGMVTYLALAMLAGFGSLEFFQRLKETARTLFGQKAEKTKWEKIDELYSLHKKGILSETEFNELKAQILKDAGDIESKLVKKQPEPETGGLETQQEEPEGKSQ